MIIKIVRRPKGEAPSDIRDCWIGCVMGAKPYAGPSWGIISRQVSDVQNGFRVNLGHALDILAEKSDEAADWFALHSKSENLIFYDEEAEVVSKRGKVVAAVRYQVK